MAILLCSCSQEEIAEEIAVGATAPDFCLKDTEGNIIILSNYAEQPIVLRFFETDCRFCRADTPIINVYFEKYKDKGLEVFYVAAFHETKETVTSFMQDLDVPFPVIIDESGDLAESYDVILYPQTIIIAPGRKIRAIVPGGVGEAELDELVGPYLEESDESHALVPGSKHYAIK
jgi:peroxiredoxin